MNLLGLVFSLLALLSFGASLAIDKQMAAKRLHFSYTGNAVAHRHILNHYESELYSSLKSIPKESEKSEDPKKEPRLPPPPPINPPCARLNLFPLLEQSEEEKKVLYETAAKFLRTFYGPTLFEKKPKQEYVLLSSLLEEMKKERIKKGSISFEKIALPNRELSSLYYKMLKGTKKYDSAKKIGYPSFLDYFKLDSTPSKICLNHAHPHLLSLFFPEKVAISLYATIHKQNAPALTKETIERLFQEAHLPLLQSGWADLFEFETHRHTKQIQTTILGYDPDTDISVRKVISLRK
ncbi:MAG: hypothetical protein FJZ64_01870 [Chlamydiae bacterium]|nr:hypothetical protein [Chlamydiota bacterium]